MALSIENKAFHELIVALNHAHKKYNEGDPGAATHILAGVKQGCETLIHHLKHRAAQEGR